MQGPNNDQQNKRGDKGLGIFIRGLVGLDRSAAKEVFSEFLSEGTYTSNQIQFVNKIINYLANYGVMEIGRLYEQPSLTMLLPQMIFSKKPILTGFAVLSNLVNRLV